MSDAQPEARQPPPPQGSQQVAGPSQVPAPKLNEPEFKLQFAAYLFDGTRTNVIYDPALLTRVFRQLYRTMERSLGGILLAPLTEVNFIRVCRTLVLKRIQDVREQVTGVRPDNFVTMSRGIMVPQPLGELLYAIGPYRSTAPYAKYIPMTPNRGDPVADWWTFGENNLSNFITYCDITRERYMQVSYPKQSHLDGRPFMLLYKNEAEGLGNVKLYTDAPTPADVYLRFVHEEFLVDAPFAYANCHGHGSQPLEITSVVQQYISSYIIKTGA